MGIEGIEQPDFIEVDDVIRLRKYDGFCDFALKWYQDVETVYLVDGKKEPYTLEKLKKMYEYLNEQGELYFIEILDDGNYLPVGDVTFWKDDMPIVIGDKSYRGRKIGQKVIKALVQRGRQLGYTRLAVAEIYAYNTASRKCFERVGFRAYEKTEKGNRFELELSVKNK